MLRGIFPIVLTPFDADGRIDEASLRRVTRFELDGGVHGIGVGGFASEAYKLTDAERLRCAEIVAEEVAGSVPLIIGMPTSSTEAAIEQAQAYARFNPAALMILPPCIMKLDEAALVAHTVDLASAVSVPVMVQQSPQIKAYEAATLSVDGLVDIANRAPNVLYFKIEGPGSAEKIGELHQRLGDRVHLFGGIGGMGMQAEFRAGAAGLLPGSGFNEYFMDVWRAWEAGDMSKVDQILQDCRALVQGVSGSGHEFSLHARKYLLQRAGIIAHTTVRRPTVPRDDGRLEELGRLVDTLPIRISTLALSR